MTDPKIEEADLLASLRELNHLFPAYIQDVQSFDPFHQLLTLRIPGKSALLWLSLEPDNVFLALLPQKPELPEQRAPITLQFQTRFRQQLKDRILIFADLERDELVLKARDPQTDLGIHLRIHRGSKKERFRFQIQHGITENSVPSKVSQLESLSTLQKLGAYVTESILTEDPQNLKEQHAALKKRLKKLQTRIQKIRVDQQNLKQGQKAGHWGELLKSILPTLEPGLHEVTVLDFDGQTKVNIPLRPDLSAINNMARYFAQSKKAARGLPKVEERLQESLREQKELEEALLQGIGIYTKRDLSSQKTTRVPHRTPKTTRTDELVKLAHHFQSINGFDLWVGKGSQKNDALLRWFGHSDDLWFHVRDLPGTHVILPKKSASQPSDEDLLDAGTLAVHFSKAKDEHRAWVHQTLLKYVRKRKGTAPGQVHVEQSQSLPIHFDAERLQRLLATRKKT